MLPEEAAEFQALEAALRAELAPVGALQAVLAQRVVSAAWRLMRADRIEAEVLGFRRYDDSDLGLALIRDGNGTRSVDTVLRYRGAALAEFMRALKTLQALQAEARAGAGLPAAPAARRRARPPASRRIEPKKIRHENALTAGPAIESRQNASEPRHPAAGPAMSPATAPSTTPIRDGAAAQCRDRPAPRRSRHDAPHGDRPDAALAALPAPARTTKRTPETTANQQLRI